MYPGLIDQSNVESEELLLKQAQRISKNAQLKSEQRLEPQQHPQRMNIK